MVQVEHRTESALRAIRRLLRAENTSRHQLARTTGLTPSQLVVMQEVARIGETTAGAIASALRFSQATVTNLVDKLEEQSLVARRRGDRDRRQVWVAITEKGRTVLSAAPDTLQNRFSARFETLPDWEQAMIVAMLDRLNSLLDADLIDAAPVIDAGAMDANATAPESAGGPKS